MPLKNMISLQQKTIDALERINIRSIRDLLFHVPYNYQKRQINPDFSHLTDGENVILDITILNIDSPSSSRAPLKIHCEAGKYFVTLIFFNKIPAFIWSKLRKGTNHTISGRIHKEFNQYQITHPDFIFDPRLRTAIEPIYHLTYGLTSKQLHNYVAKVVNMLPDYAEWIHPNIMKQQNFSSFKDSLASLHCLGHSNPEDVHLKRLAYDELLANQLVLSLIRNKRAKNPGNSYCKSVELQKQILQNLGFELTTGQEHAIAEIENDQVQQFQMTRLLQGDVGSGKTLVALLTMINAISAGYQAVLMAPTDILSVQHYQFFKESLVDCDIKVALLTGKITIKERRKILEELSSGEIQIIIGTHALFQQDVVYHKLGYIVIDEQHRFGVEQRMELVNKGDNADLLIMTATPIPRSLSLTLFGDIQSSQITNKPKGRLPIITSTLSIAKIDQLLQNIIVKIKNKEKIYWVCPLIDQSDKAKLAAEENFEESNIEIMDATTRSVELETLYNSIAKVGLVHGKLKSDSKDRLMSEFKNGDVNILVSTTVIEVGVDVPEATLMVIENAERFGLAQLHQLRGRVGRGSKQSYCILLYGTKLTSIARERLKIMRVSNDGFYIAEQDLKLRGGGEILGKKQSGEQQFIFANIQQDLDLLNLAHKEAVRALECADNINNDKLMLLQKIFQFNVEYLGA